MAKKTRKRKLSSWNLFVMDVRKKNPGKSFKDILVLASNPSLNPINFINFNDFKFNKLVIITNQIIYIFFI